jgi:hypothetical protein
MAPGCPKTRPAPFASSATFCSKRFEAVPRKEAGFPHGARLSQNPTLPPFASSATFCSKCFEAVPRKEASFPHGARLSQKPT